MKKIMISTIAAASIALAANNGTYEITPMLGHVDTGKNVDIQTHNVYGVAIGFNQDDNCKFDQIEVGILHTQNTEYTNGAATKVSQILLNGIKEYKVNNSFNLFALAGLGYESISNSQMDNDSAGLFEYGVGAKYKIAESLSLRADVRHQLKFDKDQNVVYLLGLSMPFGGEKKSKKMVEDTKPVLLDDDKDGVVNMYDSCRETPMGSNISVDVYGCELDSDKDGIVNSKDVCPSTQENADVDAKGCVIIPDTDRDGVIDPDDKCPNTPINSDVTVDVYGCELDSDNDGVKNSKDMCSNTRANAAVDAKGCEVVTAKEMKELQAPADLGILFNTNSAIVKSNDLPKFDRYINYLKAVPAAQIVIEAHTDSLGAASYNLALSKKRAASAKMILVNKGISANRIEAYGYGEVSPLVSNDTRANRQLNRRVTARIIK